MNSILHQQLEYSLSSELSVDTDSSFSTVSMSCEGNDFAFMEGEEADEFIDQVDQLYNDDEFNGTYTEAELICGYPYLDLVS